MTEFGIMTESGLLRLMTWFSPSYPVGAYTYSHGLEAVVENGDIKTVDPAYNWLSGILQYGTGQSDIVLLRHAYEAVLKNDMDALYKYAEFAAAFCGTKELALEAQAQGRAFLEITRKSWSCESLYRLMEIWPGPYCYPIVVGVAASGHQLDLHQTALAYLHGFTANLISALVRLVPLGQTDGQILLARLEPLLLETTDKALKTPFENISNAALCLDLFSMQHETQHTRLFRS